MAKQIIKLFNYIADKVNNDPDMGNKLKVNPRLWCAGVGLLSVVMDLLLHAGVATLLELISQT